MEKKSVKGQLLTFVPEMILLAIGIVFTVLVIVYFPLAYSYLTNKVMFGAVGSVYDLMTFMVSTTATLGSGFALLFISLIGLKKDEVRCPNIVSFVTSIVLLVIGITFLVLLFTF